MPAGTRSRPTAPISRPSAWSIFLYGVFSAYARKVPAGDNPWGAGATTLEWTLSSPPPFHQFDTLPVIK